MLELSNLQLTIIDFGISKDISHQVRLSKRKLPGKEPIATAFDTDEK